VAEDSDLWEEEAAQKAGLFWTALYKDPIFLIAAGFCFLGGYSTGSSHSASGLDPRDDVVATLTDITIGTAISLALFAYLPAYVRRRLRRRRAGAMNLGGEFTNDAWVILLGLMMGFTGLLFGYSYGDQESAPTRTTDPVLTAPRLPLTTSQRFGQGADRGESDATEPMRIGPEDVEFFKDVLSMDYGRQVTDEEALEALLLIRVILSNEDAICWFVQQRIAEVAGSIDVNDPDLGWAEGDPERIRFYALSLVISELTDDMNEERRMAAEEPISGVAQFVLAGTIESSCYLSDAETVDSIGP